MDNCFVTFQKEPIILSNGLELPQIGFSLVHHDLGCSLYLPKGWTINNLYRFKDETGECRGYYNLDKAIVSIYPKRDNFDETMRFIDFPKLIYIENHRTPFEKVGFRFVDNQNHIRVILPENWKITPTDSYHFSERIYDGNGRMRGEIQQLPNMNFSITLYSRFDNLINDETGDIEIFDVATQTSIHTVKVSEVPNDDERFELAYKILRNHIINLGYNINENTWLFEPNEFWD